MIVSEIILHEIERLNRMSLSSILSAIITMTFGCLILMVVYYFVSLQPNGNSYPEGPGLVTIRMTPDEQGRFGFNVKVS